MRFMFAALLWLITFSSVDVASAQTPEELTTQCQKGDAGGCFDLGLMYHQGRGVTQDFVQAHKWYNLAGANGYKKAVNLRNVLSKVMTPAQIAEAQKLAREWRPIPK